MEPIFSHLLIDYDSSEPWTARGLEARALLSRLYGEGGGDQHPFTKET
jgi:hypothetical protein